ncbi:MAG: protein translocase subunit SecF [Dehalococcoidia bacterium]
MDFVSKRKYFLSFSFLITILSIFMLISNGLNLGIDFTSGSTASLEFKEGDPGAGKILSTLEDLGYSESVVQNIGADQYFIRTRDLGINGLNDIKEKLNELEESPVIILDNTTVGSSIAEDTVKNAIIAVLVASLFVMAYIMYAFRSVNKSYKYAFSAILALTHDVIIVLGIFVVLGIIVNAQVNAIFIVGILTVIGYSVNDTIVIFDRVRENAILNPNKNLKNIINQSINESITRSLGTSLTTITVIMAMLLFGGSTLRDFLLVLLLGVIVGTYSSIFVASQILAIWESKSIFFRDES